MVKVRSKLGPDVRAKTRRIILNRISVSQSRMAISMPSFWLSRQEISSSKPSPPGALLDSAIKSISMMGSNEKIKWNRSAEGLTIQLPKTLPDPLVIAFKLEVK